MNGWCCNEKESLHVSLGRRDPMNQRVGSNEREVLPLETREPLAGDVFRMARSRFETWDPECTRVSTLGSLKTVGHALSAERPRSAAGRDGRAPCAPPFGEMWGGAEAARCVPGRPVSCIALLDGAWPAEQEPEFVMRGTKCRFSWKDTLVRLGGEVGRSFDCGAGTARVPNRGCPHVRRA